MWNCYCCPLWLSYEIYMLPWSPSVFNCSHKVGLWPYAYQIEINRFHESLTISDSGLHIDPRWPYVGASPYGIVHCKCCGMGGCEVKCPYACKNSTIAEAAAQKNFCLKKDEFGKMTKVMPTTTKFRPRYLSVGLNIVILSCGQQEISLCNEFVLTKSFGKMHSLLPLISSASTFYLKL